MCGLAGELRFDHQPADLAAVERITHHRAPRGPDAWGFHAQGPIALGHRRLGRSNNLFSIAGQITDDGVELGDRNF